MRFVFAWCQVSNAGTNDLSDISRRFGGALDFTDEICDGVNATFATREGADGLELTRCRESQEDLGNETAFERQLFLIYWQTGSKVLARLINGARQEAPDKAAKEVDRQFIPKALILFAIEYPRSDEFEERVRGCEIKEALGFLFRHQIGATLNQARTIAAKQRT